MPAPARKMTKDTVTVKGASAISELYNFPKTPDTEVWFLSGFDKKNKFFDKLVYEMRWCPYVNKQYVDQNNVKLKKKERFVMILVTNFDEDCANFVYVVKGEANMTKFLKMVFSGRVYDDPCFATPLHITTIEKLVNTPGLDQDQYERVSKTETKGMRWGYFFASAEKAYAQLDWSAAKFHILRKELSDLQKPFVEPISDTDSDDDSVGLSDDEISDDEISDDEISDDEDEEMEEQEQEHQDKKD